MADFLSDDDGEKKPIVFSLSFRFSNTLRFWEWFKKDKDSMKEND